MHAGGSGSGGGGEYASDNLSEEEFGRALAEADRLYNAAQEMSRLQVQQELEQSFADFQPPRGVGGDPLSEAPPPLQDHVCSFWIEQGLNAREAGQLYKEVQRAGRTYSLYQLSSKVARWSRVLPDVDVAALAAKDMELLEADVGSGLMNLIRLVEGEPVVGISGRESSPSSKKQPKILWCTDLPARIKRVTSHLLHLHPSHELDVVSEIVVDYPELLYRMDYYPDATLVDELPIEIQNMMAVGGAGIGHMVRYYKNRATNYQAEVDRSAKQGWET
eukprot:gene1961-33374_t